MNAVFLTYKIIIGPSLALLGGAGYGCRYHVTCSEYSRDAFRRLSFFKALRLSCARVLSCNPWSSPRPQYQEIAS